MHKSNPRPHSHPGTHRHRSPDHPHPPLSTSVAQVLVSAWDNIATVDAAAKFGYTRVPPVPGVGLVSEHILQMIAESHNETYAADLAATSLRLGTDPGMATD